MSECLIVRFVDGKTVLHRRVDGDYSDPASLANAVATSAGRPTSDVQDYDVVDNTVFEAATPGVRFDYDVDIIFTNGVASVSTLEAKKRYLKKNIDLRTAWLVSRGFKWNPGSGDKAFSLSANAQAKWIALYTHRALETYPIDVATRDDDEVIQIDSVLEVEDLYGVAMSTMRGHLEGGSQIKANIIAAADEAAAQAAFDADARQSPWSESPPF